MAIPKLKFPNLNKTKARLRKINSSLALAGEGVSGTKDDLAELKHKSNRK